MSNRIPAFGSATGRPLTSIRVVAAVLLVLSAVVAQAGESSREKVLYGFPGHGSGVHPFYADVALDNKGNFYGTTINTSANVGYGTVFKVDSSGHETVLHTFTGGSDGAYPEGGVVVDPEGSLYGTTRAGGNLSRHCVTQEGLGCGVVFKVGATGKETVLHTFTGGPDGSEPSFTNMVFDARGNLYGTALYGGYKSGFCGDPMWEDGCGLIFKVSTTGRYSVLHTFKGKDGANPSGTLMLDAKGNLYGTAQSGGDLSSCGGGCGVVFKIDKRGKETILYTFHGQDGSLPWGNVILDLSGNLYGTTWGGGSSGGGCGGYGCGVVFKLSTTGKYTVLYNFQGTDGQQPQGNFVMDAEGNLYGATIGGGTYGAGTAFKVSSKGNVTILYTFTGGADGANPTAGLIFDAKQKKLYGTTEWGGDLNCTPSKFGCGTVFQLVP
jgi:uncharacterized repeat protein (TIGR03803 family)